ncbi:hypothetical protein QTP88_013157 [Uroleucon formosanum]
MAYDNGINFYLRQWWSSAVGAGVVRFLCKWCSFPIGCYTHPGISSRILLYALHPQGWSLLDRSIRDRYTSYTNDIGCRLQEERTRSRRRDEKNNSGHDSNSLSVSASFGIRGRRAMASERGWRNVGLNEFVPNIQVRAKSPPPFLSVHSTIQAIYWELGSH